MASFVRVRPTLGVCGLGIGRAFSESALGEQSRVPWGGSPQRASQGGAHRRGPSSKSKVFRCGGHGVGGKGWVFGVVVSRRGEPRRQSAEEFEEAGLAIGLPSALLEGALGEWAQAEGAGEVVRVEAAAQGRHATAGHREATRSAQGTAPRVEMVLAQRAALVLEKAACREGREAFLGKGDRDRVGKRPNRLPDDSLRDLNKPPPPETPKPRPDAKPGL